MELTLLIVKPHAVERQLVGTFIDRFEKMGLSIAAIKSITESPAFWGKFYPSEDAWFLNAGSKTADDYARKGISPVEHLGTDDPLKIGQLVKKWLVSHMSSGLSVAIVLSGNEAVTKVRLACGKTLPNMAAPGTIRFDFSTDSPRLANEEKRPVYNLVHASDPEEQRDGMPAAKYEINLLFPGQFKFP